MKKIIFSDGHFYNYEIHALKLDSIKIKPEIRGDGARMLSGVWTSWEEWKYNNIVLKLENLLEKDINKIEDTIQFCKQNQGIFLFIQDLLTNKTECYYVDIDSNFSTTYENKTNLYIGTLTCIIIGEEAILYGYGYGESGYINLSEYLPDFDEEDI